MQLLVPELASIEELLPKPIYLVGGSVRDWLLGQLLHDLDYTTPLHPEMVEKTLRRKGLTPFLVGKRFGTISTNVKGLHLQVEITTFRQEVYRNGSRKPAVTFSEQLETDLARRDFTINAMALRDGQVVDLFEGQQDLQRGSIRAVGKAVDRFQEDPLRMLRAARFAAQLNFQLEKETLAAITRQAPRILDVSRERMVAELDRLLSSKSPENGLHILEESGLLPFILPGLTNHNNRISDVAPTISERWAVLLQDLTEPDIRRIGEHLHWSKKRTKAMLAVLSNEKNERVKNTRNNTVCSEWC